MVAQSSPRVRHKAMAKPDRGLGEKRQSTDGTGVRRTDRFGHSD